MVTVGGLASSAQHHQGDGPASSLGRLSMNAEQCAVVVSLVVSLMFLNLKLWSRWFRVGLKIGIDGVFVVGHGIAPVSGRKNRERHITLAN